MKDSPFKKTEARASLDFGKSFLARALGYVMAWAATVVLLALLILAVRLVLLPALFLADIFIS
tara:strand:- start:384 stop:572 length:189 start_codon:yes stop_codon:yes gene_type:complete